eukprot:g24479.t1
MDLLPLERPQVVRVVAEGGLQATLAQKSHLAFTAGVLCEHCHASGRSWAARHHVIDLSELKERRRTVCGRRRVDGGPVPCRASARAVTAPWSSWVSQWSSKPRRLGGVGVMGR